MPLRMFVFYCLCEQLLLSMATVNHYHLGHQYPHHDNDDNQYCPTAATSSAAIPSFSWPWLRTGIWFQ